MRYVRLLLAALFVVGSAGSTLAADKYNIDKTHSSIEFSVRHMMVAKVKGNFTEFSGEVMFDPDNPANSSVNVVIKSASINTDSEGRDKHLKSADFFDVETYPEITFKSTKVEKSGDGYMVYGNFTMHGVEKFIALNAKVYGPVGGRIGVETHTTINRQDYGVSWSRVLDTGGVNVGDEVSIELNIEAAVPRER